MWLIKRALVWSVWYNVGMEVKLEKFVPGGQAMGSLPDGRRVFVWGGLPGEVVEVEITKSKASYAEGVVRQVLTASPHRVEPQDDCYLATSPWQIMDYEYELAQKRELVIESFSQNGIRDVIENVSSAVIASKAKQSSNNLSGLPRRFAPRNDTRKDARDDERPFGAVPLLPPVSDNNQYGYRNKMEYSLWWDNDTSKISLAFHRRGSHQKIPIARSSIERPEIWAEAVRIVDDLNTRGEPARKYQSLMLRANQQGEVSGGLFVNGQPHPAMSPLTDRVLGREYTYSPNGFFQINLPVYELALNQIKQHIDPNLPVVDLYAGVGTIGLSVVGTGQSLTLVETNKQAYEELVKNAQSLSGLARQSSEKSLDYPIKSGNDSTGVGDGVIASEATRSSNNLSGLPRRFAPRNDTGKDVRDSDITPVLSDVENALNYIIYDINLVVDPPLAGLDERVVGKILAATPKKLVYLSCNPVTQARDIAKLLPKYDLVACQSYNFFPRTPHIENLCVLERKNG
jgi:23S rRNA (uracil1939-C5)-methyltransferase